ncbi:hypothetical protein DI09_23p250 [Mitosporidium daphniae]|uniref:Succinate--CoA ligase [ADP-forming] subunit beta, mitochondrial n=1 Tax=Mitosporidium daphniae TaxID=1485682 RepID=A0A098VSL1_9MICR|nr:uncharacterized protein DI09_23p250 [Mitosporidium daphniae]KGG51950.1 hypothetical protein DI09_23p250 [Mitosporidium daphniae]|eukprot:XP_013238377.1 uncharacterized protein DI09_23p250 [Mitosporidium daphniae]
MEQLAQAGKIKLVANLLNGTTINVNSAAIQRCSNLLFVPMMLITRLYRPTSLPSCSALMQRRYLSLHEYQSMSLFEKYKIDHARGSLCTDPNDAKSLWEMHATKKGSPTRSEHHNLGCMLKAQVLAGGRGKGSWIGKANLPGGGIQFAADAQEAYGKTSKMIGSTLVTKQTGAAGRPCSKVFICEALSPSKEYYLAILYDRNCKGPMLVGSPQGGMDIEKVAAQSPEAIHTYPIDISKGLSLDEAKTFGAKMGFTGRYLDVSLVGGTILRLYQLFIEKDASLVEINPLSEIASPTEPRLICLDAKINIDENADFRQQELFLMRDPEQEDPREVLASKAKLNYIGLDGSIGCLVNGAGLAMATMDIIKLHGGDPANFLDVGGSASVEQVSEAFSILVSDKRVSSILVNIFGGIMRCDIIAEGIVKAASSLKINVPLVVRLQGTNVDSAKKIIADSQLKIFSIDDLTEAAQKSVQLSTDI